MVISRCDTRSSSFRSLWPVCVFDEAILLRGRVSLDTDVRRQISRSDVYSWENRREIIYNAFLQDVGGWLMMKQE